MGSDRAVVAVDVGGTTMKAGILGPAGLYELGRVPTARERGPDDVLTTLVGVVERLVARCDDLGLDAAGVGVVVPGIVDDEGVGRFSVTMGWRDLPIGDRLRAAVALPVFVGHDVRAGAVAESAFGAARDTRTSLFLPIGTGVASAIVRDGVIITGDTFQAGELGQVLVAAPTVGAPDGVAPLVTLEATSSARAIAERYARAAGIPLDSIGADAVARAMADGDARAAAVWNEAVERLASVLASAVVTVDPGVVVLGGGLSQAGAALVDPLVSSLATYLPWRVPPRVTVARFAHDAGFVGCAVSAWQHAAQLDIAELAGALDQDKWRTTLAPVRAEP